MDSRGTNVPDGPVPGSDWYNGAYSHLVAPNFSFTPCLTALRHAYASDSYRKSWIPIAADIAGATRQFYSKHDLTPCRKYGLYIAGGKEDVQRADRDRMMIFVIELVKAEVHRWKDIDADVRMLLHNFELSSVSDDDRGDYGICVRYYVPWHGPRDADLFSRMSRVALTSDYGIPSFAQPDDDEPPNTGLLRTVRQIRHEQEAVARSHGRPRRAPIRTPAIPNERNFDDALQDWHNRGQWLLQRRGNSLLTPSTVEMQHVEDIASVSRDSVQDRDAQVVVQRYERAARLPQDIMDHMERGADGRDLSMSAARTPWSMPRDSVHDIDQASTDSGAPLLGDQRPRARSLREGWNQQAIAETEPQDNYEWLLERIPRDESDPAESERQVEMTPSSSRTAQREDEVYHTLHDFSGIDVEGTRPPQLDDSEDLRLDFDGMVELFGEKFKKRHMCPAHTSAIKKEQTVGLRVPIPAIEFR